jgi:hypothetical protein
MDFIRTGVSLRIAFYASRLVYGQKWIGKSLINEHGKKECMELGDQGEYARRTRAATRILEDSLE